jgi:hypothetical protein
MRIADSNATRFGQLLLSLMCLFLHHFDVALPIEAANHQAINKAHPRLQQAEDTEPPTFTGRLLQVFLFPSKEITVARRHPRAKPGFIQIR